MKTLPSTYFPRYFDNDNSLSSCQNPAQKWEFTRNTMTTMKIECLRENCWECKNNIYLLNVVGTCQHVDLGMASMC